MAGDSDLYPGDRDWPGVSAVRALAESALSAADAEAVRCAKRELIQRKNKERARALADVGRQDAEVGSTATGRFECVLLSKS